MPDNDAPTVEKKPHPSECVYLRIPIPLLRRITAHHGKMKRAAAPGTYVSRAGAIHNLLDRGLAAVEDAPDLEEPSEPKAAPKAARRRA